jgi:hypothetical protein
MAYTSNESGRNEIYVQSFPSPSTKYAVSTAGGEDPRWRRDGKELFFRAQTPGFSSGGATAMMSVTVEVAGEALKFGIPAALFDSHVILRGHAGAPEAVQYSVTADGKRFLVARQLAPEDSVPAAEPLTVVLNWTTELQRLVPTR